MDRKRKLILSVLPLALVLISSTVAFAFIYNNMQVGRSINIYGMEGAVYDSEAFDNYPNQVVSIALDPSFSDVRKDSFFLVIDEESLPKDGETYYLKCVVSNDEPLPSGLTITANVMFAEHTQVWDTGHAVLYDFIFGHDDIGGSTTILANTAYSTIEDIELDVTPLSLPVNMETGVENLTFTSDEMALLKYDSTLAEQNNGYAGLIDNSNGLLIYFTIDDSNCESAETYGLMDLVFDLELGRQE